MKHIWLLFATVFIVLAIYFYPDRVEPAPTIPGSTPAPIKPTTPLVSPSKTSPPESSPPTPKPILNPQPTIKDLNNGSWRVVIYSGEEWFDTKFPVIANQTVEVRNYGVWRFQVKIGGREFSSKDTHNSGHWLNLVFSEDGPTDWIRVDPNFRETIKVKLHNDDSSDRGVPIEITLFEGSDPYEKIEGHMELHNEAVQWAARMKKRIPGR